MSARQCILATEFAERFDKLVLVSACFDHEKLAIRLSLFLEIAIDSNLPVTKYQDLVTALLDVEQQVRREHDVRVTTVANLSYQLDHAQACRRVQSVCRLVKKNQLWTMNNRLRELCELFHTKRVRFEPAITCLTQA